MSGWKQFDWATMNISKSLCKDMHDNRRFKPSETELLWNSNEKKNTVFETTLQVMVYTNFEKYMHLLHTYLIKK